MPDIIDKKQISCKLTTPELRRRKEEVIAVLKDNILQKEELSDGFKYRFDATDEMLDQLTSFIKSERLCCDFFNFDLTLNDQLLWLSITGPNGSKEFIKIELEF